MLFVAFLQAQEKPDVPVLHRVYRKKQTDRYEVTVDSEGGAGSAHYEYQVKMFAEHPIEKSTDTKVDVTFMNLRAEYGDQEAPEQKIFGLATYQFPVTGFPGGYSLASQNSFLLLPILSWYLPGEHVAAGGEFQVSDIAFDGNVHVSGDGSLVSQDEKKATIKMHLFIGAAIKSATGDDQPAFNSTAVFDVKTGMLLTAEGDMKGANGSMSFKLKKI